MNLPALTFICGAAKSGRSTLAHALFDATPALQVQSFASPLHDAILGLFFEHAPLELSTRLDDPIPGLPNETIGGLSKKLENFLVGNYSNDIMGKLVAARIHDNMDHFERFVIDDGDLRRIMSIRKIVDTIGPENCLIVNMIRGKEFDHAQALSSLRCDVITIHNVESLSPAETLLAAFNTALSALTESPAP